MVIVGGGRVGRAVLARLPSTWTVVVVDHDPAAEGQSRAVRADARFVGGDGSSRLTLERAELDARSVLVAATSSDAVNREAARVAREHFGVAERVVVNADPPDELGDGLARSELVRPADAVAGQVVNRVSIEASRAVDVGLGLGEVLQVTVLEGSPAVGRALRDFAARHWLVAAVYRAGKLIVPHGDTQVAANDRVLLVGDPADLQDVAPYFRGGAPVFPSQYGSSLAYSGGPAEAAVATRLAASFGLDDALPVPADLLATRTPAQSCAWLDEHAVGCLLIPGGRIPWYVRLGLVRSSRHALLVAARRPVVVLRGTVGEVRRVLVCVREPRAQREVLLAAIDVSRLLGAEIHALTVHGGDDERDQARLAADLDRVARLYGVDIVHHHHHGNPVASIRSFATDYDLVVLGLRAEHNSLLAPDVSTFLLHDLPVSAVFVPWSPGA